MRKKIQTIVKRFILLAIVIIILVTGFFFIADHYYNSEIHQVSSNTTSVQLSIQQGEGIDSVAYALYTDKVISNTFFFSLYLKLNGLDKTIEAGKYLIPAKTTILQVGKLLQKGNFYTIVTIPPGLRIEEQAASIDTQLSNNNPTKAFDPTEYISLAHSAHLFNYPFLSGVYNDSMEGFLFPDTYQVSKNISAHDMIVLMLNTFNEKVYSQYSHNANGLSFYQNLTLASLLEREAKSSTDQRMIADILLRRLNQNFPLGVDSTIQYELGYSTTEKTWWRQNIFQDQLDADNPYNTRKNPGLPPSPICNTGIQPYMDATTPISNNYFYYISDDQSNIHYAITLDQQNANI